MRLLKEFLLGILFVVLLGSCSTTDLIKTVNPLDTNKPSLAVETQIGKEANKQIIVGDQSKVETDNVSGGFVNNQQKIKTGFSGSIKTDNFTVNEVTTEMIWYISIAIFVVGVLFPSPFEIYRWFRGQITLIRRTKKEGEKDGL